MEATQTACESFHQQIGGLRDAIETASDRFGEFVANPSPQVQQAYASLLERARASKDTLIEAYQEKVIEMLATWKYGYNLINSSSEYREFWLDQTRQQIQFEDSGRVIYGTPSKINESRMSYFPTIIRKVEGRIKISNNDIEHVDYLEEAGDDLIVALCKKLQSANRLKQIKGVGDFALTEITELPALTTVGGILFDDNTSSRQEKRRISLPALEAIGKTKWAAEFTNVTIADMGKLRALEKTFILEKTEIEQPFTSLETIEGALFLTKSDVHDFRAMFPALREVKGGGIDFSIVTDSEDIIDQVNQLISTGQLRADRGVKLMNSG